MSWSIHLEQLVDAANDRVLGFFNQTATGKGSGVPVTGRTPSSTTSGMARSYGCGYFAIVPTPSKPPGCRSRRNRRFGLP